MLNAQASQFKLADDGRILYQPHPTNPLPGDPVASLRKGPSPLAPDLDVMDAVLAGLGGIDKAVAKDFLAGWLKTHIATVLETLKGLEDTDALAGPVRGICFQLAEAMGIVPRENLEDLIQDLDSPMRQSLRAKQVRLGPVLVFLPALNKPAAVRLRGLLWSLWNDRALPAQGMPADGVVSFKIDPQSADRRFFQAIGYPVYGPRAIRIDMLDRVISAVYDNAKDGKFRAEHKMAEWLGCSIDDLYEVLGAMGHRRIQTSVTEAPAAEAVVEVTAEAVTESAPTEPVVKTPDVKPDVKPELAQFWLKKGKAFQTRNFVSKKETSSDNAGDRKPFNNKKAEDAPRHKKARHDKPHREPRREQSATVISAGAPSRPEDSPFAILQQLKTKKDAASS